MASGTIGSQLQSRKGLAAKDLVFIAIFGGLIFLIFLSLSMLFSVNPNICWFTHTAGAIPAGIVWMYLLYRVPKRGAIAIMGVIVAAIGFLMGMFWSGPVGIIVGSLVAELILGAPERRTTAKMIVAFAAFTFCFWFGQISLIIIGGQAYVDMCVAYGMTAEYGHALVNFIFSPMVFVCGVTTICGASIGGFLGSKIFAKHFAKMSA
ncbi:MAG: MptD family putative ECF transporter S component [Gordonibacter sp.]|nr:MptD family putative ECF transporter S component [Gordonibacter sp.]